MLALVEGILPPRPEILIHDAMGHGNSEREGMIGLMEKGEENREDKDIQKNKSW